MLAIALGILDVIVCIALVLLVVFQEGNAQGLGSIGGVADTFYGQNKGRSIDQMLKRFTSFLAIFFAILTVVLFYITNNQI